jgi:hypothetical protein
MQLQNLLNPPALNLPSLSSTIHPSAYDFLTTPNPLASSNLPYSNAIGAISEAISSIQPGTINVVGGDQSNVTTHIHMGKQQTTVNVISTSSNCPFRT